MKALLLCAGQGSRFQPQTLKHPKVALPFLNIPIMSYPLSILEEIKTQSLLVNTHHHPKHVESTLHELKPDIRNIHFSYEPTLLGGAGTLKKHKKMFQNDHTIYLNGDAVFLCENFFSDLKKQHELTKALMTFLVTPAHPRYRIDLWANEDRKIVLKPSSKEKGYFFPGLALIHPKCFSLFQEGDHNIFHSIVQRHPDQCFVHIKNVDFFEVGSLFSYLQSTHICLKNLFSNSSQNFSKNLKKVLKRFKPDFDQFQNSNFYSTTKINQKPKGFLLCGKNVEGIENININHFAVIGDNCNIKKPILLDSCVLSHNVHISQDHLTQALQI